jgi:hypothetical protein
MTRQYRQGDVLLCAIDEIPLRAMPEPSTDDRVVLAWGELTGHAHVFPAHEARLFRDEASGRAFVAIAEGGAALVHEEHTLIRVPEGQYELRRQREYTPQRRPRYVAD